MHRNVSYLLSEVNAMCVFAYSIGKDRLCFLCEKKMLEFYWKKSQIRAKNERSHLVNFTFCGIPRNAEPYVLIDPQICRG